MNAPCIIVNMTGHLDCDRFENERIIPKERRPSYVHDDLEAAPTVAVLEPYERPVAPISQTVAYILKEGDIRQAGDEYYDGKWKPIPEDRHGLPIFPGSFPHRRPCSHTSEKTKLRRKKA